MYPRGKTNATPTPVPVAKSSSEDDFDLEKLIKYVTEMLKPTCNILTTS